MFKNLNASSLGVAGHQSEIIELALTYGFRGMDLDAVELLSRVKLHGMPYARRLIESARNRLGKFEVGTFNLPLEWDTDDDVFKAELAKLPDYAGVAAEIGCTRCLASIAPAGDMRPYHENFEFHRHRFADICKVLESSGVRLGVGFRAVEALRKSRAFQFIHDFDALSLLVNMVGAANIGVVLDVWELFVSGGSVDNVRGLTANQIVAVQLADARADDTPAAELTEEARFVPQEAGRIDLKPYMVALAELDYDGPVTVKPNRNTLGGMRRDPIVKMVSGVLDRIWKEAGLTPDGKLAVPVEN